MIRALDKWLWSYVTRYRRKRVSGPVHVMIAICDHFEPLHDADKETALRRLAEWRKLYPDISSSFPGEDGVGPRHTFFYPVEQYMPELLTALEPVCEKTGSEVEVHLHHADSNADEMTEVLRKGVKDLSSHGFLSRDGKGNPAFGFVHGNWALDNSHPKGRHCGVSEELKVLKRAGCYADFTLPSAPSPCQTRTINSLYYAESTSRPKSHDHGIPVSAGETSSLRNLDDWLLMVQGPLGLNWQRRKLGLLPRIENADLTRANPPSLQRFRIWCDLGVHVRNRPDWLFVKLHTHGGIPENYGMLLGEPMQNFYKSVGWHAANGSRESYCIHYVTAREMVNLIHAAEDLQEGPPESFRNYLFKR